MAEQRRKSLLAFYLSKHPELKRRIDDHLKKFTEDEKRRHFELADKFVNGELTWAEIRNVPPGLLKFLARVAYQEFQSGHYEKAEALFKGLAVLDHKNWYYRAALGAVFQKRGQYERAVEEFSTALQLNPNEVTSLVNRGQCYLVLDDPEAASSDFNAASTLPLPPQNPWLKRAQSLSRVAAARVRGGELQ